MTAKYFFLFRSTYTPLHLLFTLLSPSLHSCNLFEVQAHQGCLAEVHQRYNHISDFRYSMFEKIQMVNLNYGEIIGSFLLLTINEAGSSNMSEKQTLSSFPPFLYRVSYLPLQRSYPLQTVINN